MFGLFVAVPFGTLAYLAIWGFFDRGGAAVTLGMLLLTSVIGTVLLGFLHGLVPGVMVSIVDALGAEIIAILRNLSRRWRRRRLAAPPSSVGTAEICGGPSAKRSAAARPWWTSDGVSDWR